MEFRNTNKTTGDYHHFSSELKTFNMNSCNARNTKMMCTSSEMSKIDMIATTAASNINRKPLCHIRRRSSVAINAESILTSPVKNVPSGKVTAEFYCNLNDDESSQSLLLEVEKRTEKRREARRRGRRPPRPDASGRIGNKECHLWAFAETIEEQVAEALAQK